MAKQTRICRVCGAEYQACNSIKPGDNKFNWREVACSPECGQKYFQAVMEARGEIPASRKAPKTRRTKMTEPKEEISPIEVQPIQDGTVVHEDSIGDVTQVSDE